MRHAAQCVGRVLRGKTDYGLMIFADKRFAKADKRNKLPKWIGQYIKEPDTNLSTDMAINQSKKFLREMAQPFEQDSKSLWGLDELLEKQRGGGGGIDDDDDDGVRMEVDMDQADVAAQYHQPHDHEPDNNDDDAMFGDLPDAAFANLSPTVAAH